MDFKTIFITNWKTTTAAIVALALSGLHAAGVSVPGFSDPGLGAALTAAIGLIFASDTKAS